MDLHVYAALIGHLAGALDPPSQPPRRVVSGAKGISQHGLRGLLRSLATLIDVGTKDPAELCLIWIVIGSEGVEDEVSRLGIAVAELVANVWVVLAGFVSWGDLVAIDLVNAGQLRVDRGPSVAAAAAH
jgi:hypothetical protein